MKFEFFSRPWINEYLIVLMELAIGITSPFRMGKLETSPVYVTYTGVAKSAERLEIRLELAF
jgi:hypothetical protein